MPKTKIVRKNAYMRLSEAKGQRSSKVSVWSATKESFRYALILFHLLMQKDLKQKHFSK